MKKVRKDIRMKLNDYINATETETTSIGPQQRVSEIYFKGSKG
ncbi:MAG: hypothetical protein Q8L85_08040 [Alphaproteobacteria bacterium]|nr:hypothetical protein [Alphaproteobacteria bacterium]